MGKQCKAMCRADRATQTCAIDDNYNNMEVTVSQGVVGDCKGWEIARGGSVALSVASLPRRTAPLLPWSVDPTLATFSGCSGSTSKDQTLRIMQSMMDLTFANKDVISSGVELSTSSNASVKGVLRLLRIFYKGFSVRSPRALTPPAPEAANTAPHRTEFALICTPPPLV